MAIQPIGVPFDLQQPETRMGRTPALLLPQLSTLSELELREARMLQVTGLSGALFDDIARIAQALSAEVRSAQSNGDLPLVIGGDCLCALGVSAGLQRVSGLIWIDAHGDFNTPETTPSNYLGGMPLAIISGRALPELRLAAGLQRPIEEQRIALLGVRDLDPLEEQALLNSDLAVISTTGLRSSSGLLDATLNRLGNSGPIALHLDVDVLDPSVMPNLVYPAAGGLRLGELQALLRHIHARCSLAALTLTALNPDEQHSERQLVAALTLLRAALELPGAAAGTRSAGP